MENNVLVLAGISPPGDGVYDCQHLLHLDMLVSVATRAPLRVPVFTEVSPETLGARSVSVDVNGFAILGNEVNSIPARCKGLPPLDVPAGAFRYPTLGEA